MLINIANEHDLHKFISLDVSAEDLEPKFRHYQSKSLSLQQLRSDKHDLAQYMATRYLRDRLRRYWGQNLPQVFLPQISIQNQCVSHMPFWVKEGLKNNEKIYLFEGTKVPMPIQTEIRRVGLFLSAMAEEYIDSIMRFAIKFNRPIKVYLDYLKGKHDYPSYEMALLATQKWEQNELKQQMRDAKIHPLMQLPNGYYAVELLNKAALKLEGRKMANCLGDELQPYLQDIESDTPSYRIFSIRNREGTPRVDVAYRTHGNRIVDCAGKANDYVHQSDVPAVCAFINQMKLPVSIAAARHARLLEADGVYYDVFHLPPNIRFHEALLNLEGLDLRQLPKLENVVLSGSFMCAHNKLTNLKGAPKIVRGAFSFYDNPIENLEGFPDYVGSVISPVLLDDNLKTHVVGDINMIPPKVSNLVRSNLLLEPCFLE